MVNFGKFFFGAGGRGVDPNSVRQLTLKCKGEGKVYDKATGECRDKKRPGRKNVGPLLKDLMADCKARGKVLDRATKECRDKKPRGRKADSQVVFFGVMPPPSHFRQAVQYHSPASKLLVPDYGALGRVVNPTGPASMMVASSIASPEMKFSVGMKKPAMAAKAAKA
jgi:hypothetical protein